MVIVFPGREGDAAEAFAVSVLFPQPTAIRAAATVAAKMKRWNMGQCYREPARSKTEKHYLRKAIQVAIQSFTRCDRQLRRQKTPGAPATPHPPVRGTLSCARKGCAVPFYCSE